VDIYLLTFLFIILVGSVTVYIYYLKEKHAHLHTIERGFCPKCRHNTIVMTDKRAAGSCGTKLYTYECETCGYTNSFSIDESCSGGCR